MAEGWGTETSLPEVHTPASKGDTPSEVQKDPLEVAAAAKAENKTAVARFKESTRRQTASDVGGHNGDTTSRNKSAHSQACAWYYDLTYGYNGDEHTN